MTFNAIPGDRQLALAPLDENVDHVRGAPAGPLILEYGDYECPYSRQAFHAIEQAGQHRRLALARPDSVDQPVEQAEFVGSAPQLRGAVPAAGRCHHLTGTALPHPLTGKGDWPLADASAPDLRQPFITTHGISFKRAPGPRQGGPYAQPGGTQPYAPSLAEPRDAVPVSTRRIP